MGAVSATTAGSGNIPSGIWITLSIAVADTAPVWIGLAII